MKTNVAKYTSKIIAVLNRFDVPQVLSCSANAVNLTTGEQASFWENTALPTVQETDAVRSSLSILTKKGRMFWLWDERLPNAGNLQSALQRRLEAYLPKESGGDAPPPSRIGTLRVLADEVREWSQRQAWSEEERDSLHGAVLFLQPEGASILTFGKARVQVSTNRVRLRNLFSTGTFKDFLQDLIKSRVQERIATEISHEDWSWAINNEPFTCRLEHMDVGGAVRFAILASDIWLPTETEIVCGAALEHHGGTASAALAMRTAFGRIGERPRGACAVVDVLPQGVDTPDADDMMNAANKAAQAFKAVKGSSVLGFGLGKLAVGALLVGVLAYGAWQWWTAGQTEPTPPQKAEEMHRTHSDSTRRAARLLQDSTDLDETDAGDKADTLQSTNTAIEKTVIAFENVPRTVVPILLKTSQPIAASNLASRVKVEIRGAQNITKYRVELDTAKRQLPPQTTRLNVIIEQPLSAGKYSVKLTYSEREVTTATVEVKTMSKQAFIQTITETPFAGTTNHIAQVPQKEAKLFAPQLMYLLTFGEQIQKPNKVLAFWEHQIKVRFGASLAGVIKEMAFCYRFISFTGDTSATERMPFNENVKRGVQRGKRIPAFVQKVESWLEYTWTDDSRSTWARSVNSVEQQAPEVYLEKNDIRWAYKARLSGGNRSKYYPNDIEVTIPNVVVAIEDVLIDTDTTTNTAVSASFNDLRVPEKPSIYQVRRTGLEKIIGTIKQSLEYSDATALNAIDASAQLGFRLIGSEESNFNNLFYLTYLLIFTANNELVELEKETDFVKITPLSAKFEKGRYSCTFLLSNLPSKPKNEEWVIAGIIKINPGAYVMNPRNRVVSNPSESSSFQVPILIRYK